MDPLIPMDGPDWLNGSLVLVAAAVVVNNSQSTGLTQPIGPSRANQSRQATRICTNHEGNNKQSSTAQ